MATGKRIAEIKATGILPGSYFPSRYYPKTLATENPEAVLDIFREHVTQWLNWYPQDAGTPFYANLKRVAAGL